MIKYDTTLSFTSNGSYQRYNTSNVNSTVGNLTTPSFDGKYIYYPSGLGYALIRYDTTASFTQLSSYSTMYLTSITTMTSGSWGSVFDGRFVYLVSRYTGLIIA